MSTKKLPPFPTVAIVIPTAIVGLLESLFVRTARRIVMVSSRRGSPARGRIDIDPAELLPTLPTPGPPTPRSDDKGSLGRKTARKNIITGIVLEAPSSTPRTLLSVVGHPYRFIGVKARPGCPFHPDP